MNVNRLTDPFLHSARFSDPDGLRRARLLVRTCLLTSLFSSSYIWLSILFDYPKGIYFMIFNVIGFLLLPLLLRTRIRLEIVGNLFILIGATAVLFLIYYSGGIWSAIYPWIISIPVLALLIVNRTSAWVWGGISLGFILGYAYLALQGFEFPTEYNTELKTEWHVSILPGLLLIILLVSFVFQSMYVTAVKNVEETNKTLTEQNETIAQQSQKLEKLLEEKDYIIRVMAHDLRNPLSNVSSLVELMQIEKDPKAKENIMAMIVRATTKARDLVNKVLEMNVSDQENEGIELTEVNIIPLTEAVISSFQEALKRKELEVSLSYDTDTMNVQADKTYLALILDNLLSNAIKFSESGSTVFVQLSKQENLTQIKVIDKGPGIHPDHEDQLFKKFSKIGTRTTAGESSTGLGLSLVKRYAELIKATVRYERTKEKGATFVVEFAS